MRWYLAGGIRRRVNNRPEGLLERGKVDGLDDEVVGIGSVESGVDVGEHSSLLRLLQHAQPLA